MGLNFFFENIDKIVIDSKKITNWVNDCIVTKGKTCGDLNFIFCSDRYLLKLNKKHLQHDYFTDILTFNYNETNIISGDIFISLDRVKENATLFKQVFVTELHRVMIHGILHLLGLDDHTEDEKKRMRKAEDDCLSKLSA